jgi:hypothetical protein
LRGYDTGYPITAVLVKRYRTRLDLPAGLASRSAAELPPV